MNLLGLRAETDVLTTIAERLGQYAKESNRDDFERTLQALGVDSSEASTYWEALVPHANGNGHAATWREAKNNTEMTERFGIQLRSSHFPRNLLLYRLLECHFPDILKVQVVGQRHLGGAAGRGNPPEKRVVMFSQYPKWSSGNPMAVHRVYQGQQPAQFTDQFMQAAEPLRELLGESEGVAWAQLLLDLKMLIPPQRVAEVFARVVGAGQRGEVITLVGAFCPDYAYENTGNPQIPYRYTFDGVGEGVGLVAQQFVRIVPAISQFLTTRGIAHRIVLGIGDFEADSEAVLARVGVDRPTFVQRCQASLDAFAKQVPAELPLTLELFGEGRGKGRLREYARAATAAMVAGDFGQMAVMYPDLSEVLARIPQQYRTFYERWYGHPMDDTEVNGIVFDQGGEYAATTRIYAEDFGNNVIMLAGDRPEMHRFNTFFQPLPTLCAKRAY